MISFIAFAFYFLQFVFPFQREDILHLKRQDEWTDQEGCGACNAAAGVLTGSCGQTPTDPAEYEQFFTCVCGLDDTFFEVFRNCIEHCPSYPYHRESADSSQLRSEFCERAQEYATETASLSLPASGLELFTGGTTVTPHPNTTIPVTTGNATVEPTTTITIIVASTTTSLTSPISIASPTAEIGRASSLDFPGLFGLLLWAFV